MTKYGPSTEAKIDEVVRACRRHGRVAIIALAGVPGTGKSYVASIAAQRFAADPLMVKEIQFHQSFSYEEFVEGLRISEDGTVIQPGFFLEWNSRALEDPDHNYVILIEELTRANLASVLGELLTFVEYRDRPFVTTYSRQPVLVAPNLCFLATYNPTDRSAIEVDAALLRRLRIIRCPPSVGQLSEMLEGRKIRPEVVAKLQEIFRECEKSADYEHFMPFGHGIFSDVQAEQPDLHELWEERIRHFLQRPLFEPNPFAEKIRTLYPWRDKGFTLP
jgi:MoxR-like ATPase